VPPIPAVTGFLELRTAKKSADRKKSFGRKGAREFQDENSREFQNRSSNPEERLDTGKAAWDKALENYQLPVMVTKEFSLASCSVPENRTILCVGTGCRSPLAMTALFGFCTHALCACICRNNEDPLSLKG
jgi:hypothetical protein